MTTLETPKRSMMDNASSYSEASSAISVAGITKRYGNFTAVDDVKLEVARGEIFGLLGPNGAGKTTTIDLLVGLRVPDAGAVSVLGMTPSTDRAEFTRRVAVQPQEASLYDTLTVAETLRLFASLHEQPRSVAEVAELIGLADQAKVRAKKLSGGQRRRLLLGVALIGNPELVVLDEPSAGLDPAARKQLWKVISGLQDRGTTVLLTTHHMDEAAALCDRVAIMVDGRIVQLGTPDQLVRERSAHRRISFDVGNHVDLSILNRLGEQAAITRKQTANGFHIQAVTDEADAFLGELMRAGIKPNNLTVETDTLEDVFLELAETSDYSTRLTKKNGKSNERNR